MKAIRYNTQYHNVFWAGDHHLFHKGKSGGILRFHRPQFRDCREMHECIMENHNSVVGEKDYVIFLGDTSFGSVEETWKILCKLNGNHLFLEGCHDDTIMCISRRPEYHLKMIGTTYLMKVDHQIIFCSHYANRTWPRKHYGSWNVYAHSHSKLPPYSICPYCGKEVERFNAWDCGLDNNDLFPVSSEQLEEKITNLKKEE